MKHLPIKHCFAFWNLFSLLSDRFLEDSTGEVSNKIVLDSEE